MHAALSLSPHTHDDDKQKRSALEARRRVCRHTRVHSRAAAAANCNAKMENGFATPPHLLPSSTFATSPVERG